MIIALDATYSTGQNLTGVGNYCREMLFGLARAHAETNFLFCYRPHKLTASFDEFLPRRAYRVPLFDFYAPGFIKIFHGLNQRMPKARYKRGVSTFHDLFVMTHEYSTPEFRRRFTAQARGAAEKSDLIITVSQFTAGQVMSLLNVESSRIRVIPHGVHMPPEPDENAPPPPPKTKFILNVGAIQTRKNIERLVVAFEALPSDWHLVLAGGHGFGADQILARIEKSPARERIHLPGFVSAETLEKYYRQAAIFAFPSLDEGFGMPVLEAMAHGIPVITSNRSAMPEAAGDAAILVDPTEQDELTLALRMLATTEGLRKDLSEQGKRHAKTFSWRNALDATWSVYQELL